MALFDEPVYLYSNEHNAHSVELYSFVFTKSVVSSISCTPNVALVLNVIHEF